MRGALWLVALFAVAAGAALLIGGNQSSVTVFWAPYRVDVSLNFVLLGLLLLFVVLHLALRALGALFALPRHARRWRLQQKERAMHAALLGGLTQLMGGRYLRAIRSVEEALALEALLETVRTPEDTPLRHAPQLRALAHLIAAESAQALRDRETRARHLQAAQAIGHTHHRNEAVTETVEATYLAAARWSLSDRDAAEALRWLDGLRQGAMRRTLALRMRLKAARFNRRHDLALDTARQLVKHGAFSELAGQTLRRELALAALDEVHDSTQLQRVWRSLDADERAMPEVALHAAARLSRFGGAAEEVMLWLTPLWNRMVQDPDSCSPLLRERIVRLLAQTLAQLPPDLEWLTSIDRARQVHGHWGELQFLAGMVCWHHALWGKAQQLLEQASTQLQSAELQRQAWSTLAQLAEQRGDAGRALSCWKQAAAVIRAES